MWKTGHIKRYCPKQSYRPPIVRGRGGQEEASIQENVVAEVMVVTNSTGVAGKLELLQHNMVGARDRQVIGPIVMLSLGDLSGDI